MSTTKIDVRVEKGVSGSGKVRRPRTMQGVVVVSDAGTVRSALFVMNKNKKRMNLSQSPPESLSCLFPIVWPRRRNAGKATAEWAFFLCC